MSWRGSHLSTDWAGREAGCCVDNETQSTVSDDSICTIVAAMSIRAVLQAILGIVRGIRRRRVSGTMMMAMVMFFDKQREPVLQRKRKERETIKPPTKVTSRVRKALGPRVGGQVVV